MLTRRGLLTVAGAASAVALAACTGDDSASPAPPLNPGDWSSVRAQFALDPAVANLATFVFASHPAGVRAAIERHRAALDKDPTGYLAEAETALEDAVLAAAATDLATRPDQIALTDSTTMGLGLLYSGLRLAPGDEVITTEHDFYSTHESLALRAIADALAAVNRNRAESERVLLCVDGVHGFAAEAATPDELGCDFLVAGCHKWLFGPRGTGFVWGRPAAWARYTPVIPSFSNEGIGAWLNRTRPDGPAGRLATPGGYHSFEHRWALAAAFELRAALGRTRVAQRTQQLAAALKQGLAGVSRVRLRTPGSPELSAGIVCCELDGISAPAAVARLRNARVRASATPYATTYLRFGTSIVNSESDVDAAVRAVRDL